MEYRMYGLVPYNLSPIQQGIQFGHAVVEYMVNHYYNQGANSPCERWAERDNTFIVLNGGTTNTNPMNLGTLNKHYEVLRALDVRTATFKEPDLGDQLTAVVFLVDERVWDEEKYPSLMEIPDGADVETKMLKSASNSRRLIDMGGEEIWEFRQFLKQFKLA